VFIVVSGRLLFIVVVSPGLVVAGSGVSQAKKPVNTIAITVITVFIIEIFKLTMVARKCIRPFISYNNFAAYDDKL
jgi:hypothetical protein